MGNLHLGSQVEITLFKKELAAFNYRQIRVWLDLGFIGIDKTMIEGDIQIGYKKTKNKPLTDMEKVINFEISRVRIKVEHAIGGLKRYYILRHENRLKNPVENRTLDLSIEVCAGLWNFRKAA